MRDRKSVTAKDEVYEHDFFTDYDVYLFWQGRHFRLYEKLGSEQARAILK